MKKIVYDGYIILNLNGLRFISKTDTENTYKGSTFSLSWAYKGQLCSYDYKNKEERDSMFQKVIDALTSSDTKTTV